MMARVPLLPAAFIFISHCLSAQWITSEFDPAWSKGTITLNTGEKLTGQVSYNDVENVIGYKPDAHREIRKTFQRSDVLALEHYDAHAGIMRKYYSLALIERRSGDEDDGFYEMIKEYEDFAVVSKMSFTFLEKTVSTPSTGFTRVQKAILRRSEQIYFLDKNGNLDPYLFIDHGYVDNGFYDPGRKDGKIIDKTVFQKYAGTYWPEIERYLENNRIKINNRENLMCALGLYDSLLAEPVFNFPAGIFMDSTLIQKEVGEKGVD